MDAAEVMRDSIVANVAAVAVGLCGFPMAGLFLFGGAAALLAEGAIHAVSELRYDGRLGASDTEVKL